ncbi:sulfur-oxidizing protein SoxZ [Pacificibacter maritimus]|uniref:Sulfur-oxidizing protein SoxZ n=1 Tax=Pacificibacter maritimus TaxID=762213 RepID=A0A3N4UUK3_9RHOB|nr:thiosulfate oxidation carrier complex protein SoxZ [Pacificibacter maritimus]RPE71159.1 sulfur-oxidizing protein SoxZ [Pacificibacter maritimus]
MALGVIPHVDLPQSVAIGETVVLKTSITHPMESGLRKDSNGKVIPRSIINRFSCDFNDQPVIDVKMEAAIAQNPYFEFTAVVHESGTFTFRWYDDDGDIYVETKDIAVV